MIEIKCTKKQKAVIIQALLSPQGCLWPRKQAFCGYDPNSTCKKCFETKIKWTLSDNTAKMKGGKRDE